MNAEETLRHTQTILCTTPERWIWMTATYPGDHSMAGRSMAGRQ